MDFELTKVSLVEDEQQQGYASVRFPITGDVYIFVKLQEKGRVTIKKGNSVDGPFPKVFVSPITGPKFELRIYGATEGTYLQVITSKASVEDASMETSKTEAHSYNLSHSHSGNIHDDPTVIHLKKGDKVVPNAYLTGLCKPTDHYESIYEFGESRTAYTATTDIDVCVYQMDTEPLTKGTCQIVRRVPGYFIEYGNI